MDFLYEIVQQMGNILPLLLPRMGGRRSDAVITGSAPFV